MWIIIRLLLSLAVAVSRMIYRLSPKELPEAGNYQGMPYYLDTSEDKKETELHSSWACCFLQKACLNLDQKEAPPGYVKLWGLALNIRAVMQTSMKKIYLACDHPVLLQQLGSSTQSRDLILELLVNRQFVSIWSDGEVLWASKQRSRSK